MSSAASATPRLVPRLALLTGLLLAVLVVVPGGWVPGSPAGASESTASPGTTPSGGSVDTSVPEPTPLQSTDYDGEVGGPHQDTPEERTGGAVSAGTGVFIVTVLVVVAGIVVTLAVRARRRRRAGEGDLS